MQFGLSEAVAHWGCYRAGAEAVVEDGSATSYSSLNRQVNQLAALLTHKRIHGDRIAIACESKKGELAAILACLRVGRSAVVLHQGVGRDVAETHVRDTKPGVLLHDGKPGEYGVLVSNVLQGMVVDVRQASDVSPLTNEDLLLLPARSPNQEWGVVFSSGTTGPPKAIERSHYSMTVEFIGWCLELGLRKGTRFYIGRPIFYTGGLVLAASTLLAGGTVVCDNYEDPNALDEVWRKYCDACSPQALDWAFFVPDQIRSFMRLPASNSNKVRAQSVVTMGAPITGAEKAAARGVIGREIIESWGNSESLGTITDAEDVELRPDSIGRPFLTDEMCIVDDEGRRLAAGEVGRVAGGVEAGFDGYSNRPEETRRVRRHDLIISDDLGYVDEQGYFYVVGRAQESVIVEGSRVLLPEVEARARECAEIKDIGVSVVELGGRSTLAALVVPTSLRSKEEDVKDRLDALLGDECRLGFVVLSEALPRLVVGKVDRQDIARRLESEAAERFGRRNASEPES